MEKKEWLWLAGYKTENKLITKETPTDSIFGFELTCIKELFETMKLKGNENGCIRIDVKIQEVEKV